MNTSPVSLDETLNIQVDQLQQAVEKHNRNDLLELPGGVLGTVSKRHGEYIYHPLTEDALNSLLMQWVVPIKTVWASGQPTQRAEMQLQKTLIKAYMGQGEWRGVPRVTRLAPAPIIRPDLTVAWDEGYDPQSETFITEAVTEPQELKLPLTQHQTENSAKYLLSWFAPFAFENDSAKADALALVLTPMLMAYLADANIPGGLAMASKQGSGKTECMRLIALMGTGSVIAATSWPSPSKMKTDITTALNDGDRQAVLYDNVKTNLDDDSVEALLTSRWWTDRKYHAQKSLRLPNNVLWLFTKNNATVSPDMLRRLILIALDPDKAPTVWNPRVVSEAREAIQKIRTALTVMIQYWAQTGAQRGTVSISGFEVWSETVSGILEASGVKGFNTARLDTEAQVHTDDDDTADIVARIGRVMNFTDVWTAGDLWDAVNDLSLGNLLEVDRQAIKQWIGTSSATSRGQATSVGQRLKSVAGKRIAAAGVYIEPVSRSTTMSKAYRVVPLVSDVSVGITPR